MYYTSASKGIVFKELFVPINMVGISQMSPEERAAAKRAKVKTSQKVKTWKHPIRVPLWKRKQSERAATTAQ